MCEYSSLEVACCAGGDARSAALTSRRHQRLSLVVVGVITTSCCVVTALLTLAVVIVVLRHRRRHRDAAAASGRHRHHAGDKSATATPLIAPADPRLPSHPRSAGLHQSAPPLLLPDVAVAPKYDVVVDGGHQYDVLETASAAYCWPPAGPRGDGSMPGAARRQLAGRCPCSSCLLASASFGGGVAGSRLYSPGIRQTASDTC